VDSLLSEHRDIDAARRLFAQASEEVGRGPAQVATDGYAAYPRAIRETAGADRAPLQPVPEQPAGAGPPGHRAAAHRVVPYYPMRGFGSFISASRFCSAFDELRDDVRAQRAMGEVVPLAEQRRRFLERLAELDTLLATQAGARPAGPLAQARRSDPPVVPVLTQPPPAARHPAAPLPGRRRRRQGRADRASPAAAGAVRPSRGPRSSRGGNPRGALGGGPCAAPARRSPRLSVAPARPAGRLHLDPSYLVRLFTAHTGLSPMAYLGRHRAERAATLLVQTDSSAAEIGREMGWPDPNYFARRFKAYFGLGATAYRAHYSEGSAQPDSTHPRGGDPFDRYPEEDGDSSACPSATALRPMWTLLWGTPTRVDPACPPAAGRGIAPERGPPCGGRGARNNTHRRSRPRARWLPRSPR